MTDGLFDLFFIFLMLLPIVGALGTGVVRWWRDTSSQGEEASKGRGAEVRVVGLFPEGANHHLRLTNKGEGVAHDVHVYVDRQPIIEPRDGKSTEPYPWPEFSPGQTISYRCTAGRGSRRDRVLVRIEWDDVTGGDVKRTTVRVS